MALPNAIAATTEAIHQVLERRRLADGRSVVTDTATSADLAAEALPDDTQIWVWLHRLTPCPQRRVLPSPDVDGVRRRPAVAVDLHYLLVPLAQDALVQQDLLGWAIRALDDQPVLPAALLNQNGFSGSFGDTEAVELSLLPLTGQEENEIWQVAPAARRATASYVARMVRIDSLVPLAEGVIVEERRLTYEAV